MKVLLCHNHYHYSGGEDRVFFDESDLLRAHGHEVIHFTMHNDLLAHMNPVVVMGKLFWNRDAARRIRTLIRQTQPDIMHCTNIFPLISPSIYTAAQNEGVPVVQSLHNYRFFCANAVFTRKGMSCQHCLPHPMFPWRALLHGCYQESRFRSSAIIAMLFFHHLLGTWKHRVDRYIALSEFSRQIFIQGGIPADKIVVKSNFVPGNPIPGSGLGEYVLFVGRLCQEKGIEELLTCWPLLGGKIPLKIVGNGPLASVVQKAASEDPSIHYLGEMSHDDVMTSMQNARFLVMPSIMSETFGIVIIEAFASGRPVIASSLAVTKGLIEEGKTGLLYQSSNPDSLPEMIRSLWADQEQCLTMGRNARQTFEKNYTAEQNYKKFFAIYQDVLSRG